MFEQSIKELVINTDFSLPLQATVGQALQLIKRDADTDTGFYDCYITDDRGVLVARTDLHALLLADDSDALQDLAVKDLHALSANDDTARAARLLREFELQTLPVVGDSGRLIGHIDNKGCRKILTEDDQEDIERMMGIAGQGNAVAYRDLSVGQHIKNRVGWLIGLALLGFVSGSILMRFESALDQLIILAIYLPMIADTGGNAGSQSASVITRALAMGELTLRDTWRILRKEAFIALGLALALALVASLRIWFFTEPHHLSGDITLTMIISCIALALMLQVLSSTLIGALLPLIASYFNKDPAVVASPAITTLVDISGLMIYFFLATELLLS